MITCIISALKGLVKLGVEHQRRGGLLEGPGFLLIPVTSHPLHKTGWLMKFPIKQKNEAHPGKYPMNLNMPLIGQQLPFTHADSRGASYLLCKLSRHGARHED